MDTTAIPSPAHNCVIAQQHMASLTPPDPVQGDGDEVTAAALPSRPGEVVIESIEGDGGRLPLEAARNCAGIAAQQTLNLMGPMACGVVLTIRKVQLPCSCVAESQGHAACVEAGIDEEEDGDDDGQGDGVVITNTFMIPGLVRLMWGCAQGGFPCSIWPLQSKSVECKKVPCGHACWLLTGTEWRLGQQPGT